MKLESGSRVQDYILVERLGAGAFGEVWKAAHAHLPRVAAIKFATSDAAAAALEREGVAQYRLEHPGIVRVLDANLAFDPPFVVLEYVDGKSLRQLLRERGRFEIQDVSSIFRQLAQAVAYAHGRGILHGDVKPENVLVVEEGVHKRVKLTDFQLGAYKAGERPEDGGVRSSLKTRGPIGTYRYLAPEQELGEPIDGRADLFALGVVLFEMATGTLPQGRDLPSDLNPALSWWWDHMFSRCYTGRERRYRDADELLADLACAETGPIWGHMPSQRTANTEITEITEDTEPRKQASVRSVSSVCSVLEVPCAPPRRGSVMAGAAVGLLALLLPAGVLHSIHAFERLGRTSIAVPASIANTCGDPSEAQALIEEYALACRLLDEAPTPRARRELEREIWSIQARAQRAGLYLTFNALGEPVALTRTMGKR